MSDQPELDAIAGAGLTPDDVVAVALMPRPAPPDPRDVRIEALENRIDVLQARIREGERRFVEICDDLILALGGYLERTRDD